MYVKDIMSTEVGTCRLESDLAEAAKVMWDHACGFVPVIDRQGGLSGVVTDRDMCRAVAGTHHTFDRVAVRDAMSHPVVTCLEHDDVKAALETMMKRRVRRLPVVDDNGHLRGVLSIDDVIVAGSAEGAPSASEIVDALRAICRRGAVEPTLH